MRTFGMPSASTVASAMALGSAGSVRVASSNQALNSRNGSSASVKSPFINQLGCSIGAVSDIIRSIPVAGWMHDQVSRPTLYKATAFARLCRRVPLLIVLALTLSSGGCSFSYQLGSLFGKDDDKPLASATSSVTPPADGAK